MRVGFHFVHAFSKQDSNHPHHFSVNLPNQPQPFQLDVRSMPALRVLSLDSCIWNKSQCIAVHSKPSTGQLLPQTALRTLSSIVSQTLPPEILDDSDKKHDGSSSSSSNSRRPPHRQLESLTLKLGLDEFVEKISTGLEKKIGRAHV